MSLIRLKMVYPLSLLPLTLLIAPVSDNESSGYSILVWTALRTAASLVSAPNISV
jgi:hypothetical protein